MPGLVHVGICYGGAPWREVDWMSDSPVCPTPFAMEFAKKVTQPVQKLDGLVRILASNHLRKGFFRCLPETVRALFDLMDGEECSSPGAEGPSPGAEGPSPVAEEPSPVAEEKGVVKEETTCLREYLTHGQPIYHQLNVMEHKYSTWVERCHVWRGTYDVLKDGILHEEELYKSPTKFAKAHYSSLDLVIPRDLDGWTECYLKENDGKKVELSVLARVRVR